MNKFASGLVSIATAVAFFVPAFASAAVIYDNIPNPQLGNVPSVGFEATQAKEFGGQIKLDGTERENPVITVLMSSWGCESGTWHTNDCATTPGTTFSHPITLNVYNVNADNTPGTLIKTVTQTFTIPYRPSASASCTGGNAGKWSSDGLNCYSGLATPISFTLAGVTLPNKVIVSVHYNTTHYGDPAIGESAPCFSTSAGCGYDSLNVGTYSPASVGSYPLPDDAYYNSSTGSQYCPFDRTTINTFRLDPGCWSGYQPAFKIEASAPTPVMVAVHLFKYIDGVQATAESANSVSFPMFTATYGAPFTLGPSGWTAGDGVYEASTAPMPAGSSYTANEDLSTSLVGATCDGAHTYALLGYKVGDTLEAAQQAASVAEAPNFADLQSDKYVIVDNHLCPAVATLKVHMLKYLDGAPATLASAGGYLFPMTATWTASNLNGGLQASGSYVLGTNYGGAADLYGADTAAMASPADYSTAEITADIDASSKVVSSAASCAPGKYLLKGYRTSGAGFADAAASEPNPAAPQFTGLTGDQYVIVDNISCPTTGTLIVQKAAIGGNDTFSFTGDNGLGSFQITTTNGAGSKTFLALAPGTYHLTEAAQSGWTQAESSDCAAVIVTAGGPVTCTFTNTKNPKLGEIRGTKYEDWDGDGKPFESKWEEGLAGWTIYLDTDNDNVFDAGEPSTVTDSHGAYRFSGLAAGTYHVREVQKSGWVSTYPSSNNANDEYNITLGAGQIAKKKDFGNFKLGTISGMKFNDVNGNGRKDNGESGLADWKITLKGPGNSTAQTITDASGNYSFDNLTAGTYTLSEVMQPGWRQTLKPGPVKIRSATVAAKQNFGNTQKPLPPQRH